MNEISLTQLQRLIEIAEKAGLAAMQFYKQPLAVSNKDDQSPLTEADLASHAVIIAGLRQLNSAYPIVSEEDITERDQAMQSPFYWLIDPLDGTKEFLAQSDEFTINIALIHHDQAVFGVVYAPAMDLMYWGGSGMPARRRHQQQLSTISTEQAPGRLRVVASKSHLNQATTDFIAKLGTVELVQAGSSLKICRIAEGSADIYPRLGPTSEWDTAAAQAILEAAGGTMVNLQRQPLRYSKTDILNPSFVAAAYPSLIPE